ncbi:MAG: histidine phosphatase family protein [Bacillota bacterium]|nr:histidine phosphatase family protein [Bacillota bacterium]
MPAGKPRRRQTPRRCRPISLSSAIDPRAQADRPFRALIIRHGRTEYNRSNQFRGRLDIPLDEIGLEQAQRVCEVLAGPPEGWGPPVAIFTSPLTRARQTAAPLALITGLEPVVHDGLHDVDVGEWQGRPGDEVKAQYPAAYRMWETEPADFVFPGGESLRAAQDRVMRTLAEILSRFPGRTVALFTHRVPAKLLIAGVMRAGPEAFWRMRIDNGSISVVEFDGRDYVLTLANSTAHLTGAGGGAAGEAGGAAYRRAPDF